MSKRIEIDSDALTIAQGYAKRRCIPLSKAVSELIRQASVMPPTRVVNGLHVVDLPPDSPGVTTEFVRQLNKC